MTEDTPSRADATRARLEKAAIEAFAAKGFQATTTRDIATAAGMSPAALYVHHKSKEELLYLISRSGHEHTLEQVRRCARASGTATERLRQTFHDFAFNHAERHTSARIVNYELGSLSEPHLAEIRELRHQIEAEVQALVDEGVTSGDFRVPNSRMATVALLSLGIDIARWYREAGSWTPADIATEYAGIALRIVGAD